MTGPLARFRDGDQQALDEVVTTYARPAFAAALAVLGERSLAERAVRESFAFTPAELDGFDPRAQSEAAWLLARVRGRSLQLQRRQPTNGAPETGEPDAVWRTVMTTITPEQASAALGSLNEGQREIVTLAFWKGLRPIEIAKLRGLPEELVRETLRAGLERFRDAVARGTRTPVL